MFTEPKKINIREDILEHLAWTYFQPQQINPPMEFIGRPSSLEQLETTNPEGKIKNSRDELKKAIEFYYTLFSNEYETVLKNLEKSKVDQQEELKKIIHYVYSSINYYR